MLAARLLAALTFVPCLAAPTVFAPLDSAAGLARWTLANANGSVLVPAAVPGLAHLDLLRAGLVGEPYAELEVDAQRWVPLEPRLNFTAAFATPADVAARRVVELVFEGIDTVADVALNGAQLFSSTSAFVRTVVDVTGRLRAPGAGNNALVVSIASPVAAAQVAADACTGGAGQCPPASVMNPLTPSFPAVNYLRKPQVHFGWDFAGNWAPSGVWQSAYLRCFDDAVADEVTVVAEPLAPVPRGSAALLPWTATFTVFATATPSL